MAMDIYKGWPFDGAINDNAVPKTGEAIIAGMAITKDSSGELVKATGTAGDVVCFAMQDQDSPDVVFANSLPYIVKNAIVLTDQFETGSYAIGDALEVSTVAAGKYRKQTTGDKVAAYDGMVTRDGRDMMKIII